VSETRDLVGADLVGILTGGSYVGYGVSQGSDVPAPGSTLDVDQYKFAVATKTGATSGYSFQHEVGHLWGAKHGNGPTGSSFGRNGWAGSYQYQGTTYWFGTLMNYQDPRLPVFSSQSQWWFPDCVLTPANANANYRIDGWYNTVQTFEPEHACQPPPVAQGLGGPYGSSGSVADLENYLTSPVAVGNGLTPLDVVADYRTADPSVFAKPVTELTYPLDGQELSSSLVTFTWDPSEFAAGLADALDTDTDTGDFEPRDALNSDPHMKIYRLEVGSALGSDDLMMRDIRLRHLTTEGFFVAVPTLIPDAPTFARLWTQTSEGVWGYRDHAYNITDRLLGCDTYWMLSPEPAPVSCENVCTVAG